MTETPDESAFEIIKIERDDNNLLKIIGLTFKTVKVGDIVRTSDDKNTLVANSAMFEVRKIIVFGREISEVDRGYYIELFVFGHDVDVLIDKKYLYLK